MGFLEAEQLRGTRAKVVSQGFGSRSLPVACKHRARWSRACAPVERRPGTHFSKTGAGAGLGAALLFGRRPEEMRSGREPRSSLRSRAGLLQCRGMTEVLGSGDVHVSMGPGAVGDRHPRER